MPVACLARVPFECGLLVRPAPLLRQRRVDLVEDLLVCEVLEVLVKPAGNDGGGGNIIMCNCDLKV